LFSAIVESFDLFILISTTSLTLSLVLLIVSKLCSLASAVSLLLLPLPIFFWLSMVFSLFEISLESPAPLVSFPSLSSPGLFLFDFLFVLSDGPSNDEFWFVLLLFLVVLVILMFSESLSDDSIFLADWLRWRQFAGLTELFVEVGDVASNDDSNDSFSEWLEVRFDFFDLTFSQPLLSFRLLDMAFFWFLFDFSRIISTYQLSN
jgi:hypothetical protein